MSVIKHIFPRTVVQSLCASLVPILNPALVPLWFYALIEYTGSQRHAACGRAQGVLCGHDAEPEGAAAAA